jgi:hypothetical protein
MRHNETHVIRLNSSYLQIMIFKLRSQYHVPVDMNYVWNSRTITTSILFG